MLKPISILLVAISLVVLSGDANSIVFGGSNLGLFGYPDHDCSKPSKPNKTYSLDNQWQVDMYNSEVERYNTDNEKYARCINEYVDNAENDIKRVKEKTLAAIDEANS